MLSKCLILLFSLVVCHCAEFLTAPNYFGQLYRTQSTPRGLFIDEAGDLLYITVNTRSIFVLAEILQEDGTIGLLEAKLVDGATYDIITNHGIVHHNGYLYASGPSAVYRWPYIAGTRELSPETPAETVISNIPVSGHSTRTLIFDTLGVLYVTIGSDANIDANSDRARIRRFDLTASVVFPIDFSTGEVYADGVRNTVGIAFDKSGMLWGVDNGADNLDRPDLGVDIRNGNPAEEFNRFDGPIGSHYGYPYCWSSYDLEGHEPLTQFAWPSTMNDGVHTDEWCQNTENNRLPHFGVESHCAPLGITFYDGEGCLAGIPGAFPCEMEGDAFVAIHGSWNSDLEVGYKVIHVPFTKTEPYLPTGEVNDVIYEPNLNVCSVCFRPVNAVFNKNGHLLISVDESNELFKVTYGVPPPPVKLIPTL